MQVEGRKKWQLWQPNSFSNHSSSVPISSSLPISTTSTSSHILKESVAQIVLPPPTNSTSPDGSEISSVNSEIFLKLPCLRIPFEESSVYSTYDPRMSSANDVGHIPPSHDFVLEEGDILFIPKHYWHFVETETDLSLSVNLWLPYPLPPQPSFLLGSTIAEKICHDEELNIEMNERSDKFNVETTSLENNNSTRGTHIDSDVRSRLQEAATRFVFGALKGSVQSVFDTDDVAAGWINPSEQGGTLDSTGKELSIFEEKDFQCRNENEGEEEEEREDSEDKSVAMETSKPGWKACDAAISHLAYLHNSIVDDKWEIIEQDEEKKSNEEKNGRGDERKRLVKETNGRKREDYSSQEEVDGIRDLNGRAGEGEDDRYRKRGMYSKNFEGFLKRFVNALLQPERVEECLIESLQHNS